jgi:hypothetical protein
MGFPLLARIGIGFPVSEFIDPDWEDNVNSGIRLSYWPARLCGLAGRYDNPMPELTLSPSQESMNSATALLLLRLHLATLLVFAYSDTHRPTIGFFGYSSILFSYSLARTLSLNGYHVCILTHSLS